MKREEALLLVKQYVKNKNSIKHMIAVEAVMKRLAHKFKEDHEIWSLTGLLHDIDMEIVDYHNEPEKHGKKGAQILKENGVKEEIINGTLSHNRETGKKRETLLDKSIYCSDPITGLIVASALVSPSKKLSDLSPKSVVKRFKEKSFAKGADRDAIQACQEIGLELEEFVTIALSAMQEISEELEL